MKRLLCLSLCSLFLFSCSEGKKPNGTKLEPKRTVIAGVVQNYTEATRALTINYFDFFRDESIFVKDLAESSGYFHAEHDYVFEQDLNIFLSNKFITLFVSPGDSVYVTIDAAKLQNDFYSAVEFSGDNADLNNEIARWEDYSAKLNESLNIDLNCPPDIFLQSAGQIIKTVKDSIDAYAQRNGKDELFKDWAFKHFKYFNADFRGYHYEDADIWAVLTDPVFDVYNEDNFKSQMFPWYLGACMGAIVRDDDEIQKLLAENNDAHAHRLIIRKLHEKAPEGIMRDAMLYHKLSSKLTLKPELYDSLPEIKTAFAYDLFANELEKLINKCNVGKLSDDERILDGILYLDGDRAVKLPEVKLLNYLSEKYKDKVVYIDVWTTWCGPCISEFENHTPKLHNYFEGKDVVFVNLCLESESDTWKPTIKKHNVAGENYFLYVTSTRLFRGDNNLRGYPSYLIIDKEGTVHNPAPRPSQRPEVIKKIESMLIK